MKRNIYTITILLTSLAFQFQSYAQPTFNEGQDPVPAGKKWTMVESMSDEFNDGFDDTKWQKEPMENNWGWMGRAPGYFSADAVSVADGNLRVTVSKYDEPFVLNNKTWKYQGGIVRSLVPGEVGWYYECRMQANATEMSSTFWLMTQNSDCMKKNELDIQECVGVVSANADSWARNFDKIFHSNAIDRKTSCVATSTQIQGYVGTDVKNHERYFVYGCWWKSPTEMRFYLDGKYVYSMTPSKDFDMPAWYQMAIETYDWNPVPDDGGMVAAGTLEERTTKYDWVRTWKLEDVSDTSTKGIDDQLNNQIAVYPVPSKDIINIQSDVFFSSARILSLSGMVLNNCNVENNTISIANLVDGLYLLELIDDKRSVLSKFMVKN